MTNKGGEARDTKLIDRVMPPLKSLAYGWTTGVDNIKGV
jgi:hypothetical protein